jgi:peroxiredoxin Q/BCP
MDQEGQAVSLANYGGRKLVLYFYPKDDTPGCTAEACSLRDAQAELRASGYDVLGVSTDDVRSHQRFAAKYKLPFRLLADVDRSVVNAYGVWRQKKFMGREFMGIVRTTFIIDEQGRIERVIRDVDTADHAQQVLGAPMPSTSTADKGGRKAKGKAGKSSAGGRSKSSGKVAVGARKAMRPSAAKPAAKVKKAAKTGRTASSPKTKAGSRSPRKGKKGTNTGRSTGAKKSKRPGAASGTAARGMASAKKRTSSAPVSSARRKAVRGGSLKRSSRGGRA